MRFATKLFSTLVLAGALANTARAQPGITSPSFGTGKTSLRDSSYTGPYSVYGPGLSYRQLDYVGPYSGRLSSAASLAPTRTASDTALRPAGRASSSDGELGVRRPRYVRITLSGNAVQALVIP